uniref:Uncharacterized protein n=1 Tax=Coptotermes formosanus TaxID=36987 RepID=R4ULW6_COPFO|nr:hypothetical protein [Coptotermes formosanus]
MGTVGISPTMNVKIIIVALCAFQLARGSLIDDVLERIERDVNQGRRLIESAQQRRDALVTQLLDSAKSRIDQELKDLNSRIADRVSDVADAASRLPDCLEAQRQNLTDVRDEAVRRIEAVIVNEASVLLPLIGKVNDTVNEGRELLRDTISKLKAAEGDWRAIARILASAARNAERLEVELRREAREIQRAIGNIPRNVRAAVEEHIDEARNRLEDIAKEVEECVRNPPSP